MKDKFGFDPRKKPTREEAHSLGQTLEWLETFGGGMKERRGIQAAIIDYMFAREPCDDEFWNIAFDEGSGSRFRTTGFSGLCCTGYAHEVKDILPMGRTTVVGFAMDDNKDSLIYQLGSRLHDGHDFALAYGGAFLIDPWIGELFLPNEGAKDDGGAKLLRSLNRAHRRSGDSFVVLNLTDPEEARAAEMIYGPATAWRPLSDQGKG